MTDKSDVAKARQLVSEVILAQSNIFIKELLLKRQIKGGSTKADFQEQLEDAITTGVLAYSELREWVDDTEGWGDEHVYLYRVPESLGTLLRDPSRLRKRVKKAGLESVFGADTSLEFPDERALTGIHLSDGELTFVWHQGTRSQKRASEKDFEEIDDEDGEKYVYKAYREVSRRSVTRIVVRAKLGAVFLPSASEPKTHLQERESLASEIEEVVSLADWEPCSMGKAIKILDSASMGPKTQRFATARTTRLAATGGGYIEFASDTDQSYADVEPLREVRNAVNPGKFKGADGDFRFELPSSKSGSSSDDEPAGRSVKVQIYAAYDRIRTWAKLTRAETWWIIEKLPKQKH